MEFSSDKISPATDKISPDTNKILLATFAGGCFWCMEAPFEKVEGVKSVVSGYTGGHKTNPTYEEVSSGSTGHLEAVQISFDPLLVSYDTLLDIFWRQIDPTDSTGSFVDRGNQYSSAIFYHDDLQKQSAYKSKQRLEASGKFKTPVVTQILESKTFYPAEDYHQDYYKKNPLRYKFYRLGSGRDDFIEKTWKQDKK
ncbi:MAG: peptide-methionine (S)-S-oxide reductase MsrA [Desulfamplus sp.]|nr:peptide-methionine (S)-S-oxide reductase MsrA [Desulfamplus sp.]